MPDPRWILFLWLVIVTVPTVNAEQSIRRDDLRLRVLESLGKIELYYRDQLVVTKLGEFETFTYAVSNGRKRRLRGPWASGYDMDLSASRLKMRGQGGGDRFLLEIGLLPGSQVEVSLQLEAAQSLSPAGVEVDLAYLTGDLFKGGRLLTHESEPHTLTVSLQPMNEEHRYLLRNAGAFDFTGYVYDLAALAGSTNARLNLTDLRAVAWDNSQSFLLYDHNRLLIPGGTYRVSYRLEFKTATLKPAAQLAVGPVGPSPAPAVPITPDLKLSPRLPVRGQVVEMLAPAHKDIALFRRYIDALADFGANTLLFYHSPEQVFNLRSLQGQGTDWSWAELTQVIAHARQRGMRVIPGMSSKFVGSRYRQRWRRRGGSDFYCSDDPHALVELFAGYDTLLDLYRADALLIGHDEINGITNCAPAGTDAATAFATSVQRIHDRLLTKGVKTLLWGDMLLDYNVWEAKVGSAHGGAAEFGGGNTHQAIDRLPRDIVILDWHYRPRQEVSSLRYFKEKGFSVWGVYWQDTPGAMRMAESAVSLQADGILGSDWGFWRTLSPGATTLAGLAVTVDPTLSRFKQADAWVEALARRLRSPHPGRLQFKPVPLKSAVNTTRVDVQAGDGKGLFDLGPVADLRAIPTGISEWSGVDFNVAEGSNDILVATARTADRGLRVPLSGLRTPELAFLQTMYRSTPGVEPKTVGRYEVIYVDGSRERIELLENFNITDLRSSIGVRTNPWEFTSGIGELIGAWPGWRGSSAIGTPLNTQILRWRNPHPERSIQALELSVDPADRSCKLALLALSAVE